jgi:hypothetical protein
MPRERCVEVDLGSVDDQQYARTLKGIVDRHDGLGWSYAEARHEYAGDDRYVFYRDFDTDRDFQDALNDLRSFLGGLPAGEVNCSSWHQAGPPHRFDRNRR